MVGVDLSFRGIVPIDGQYIPFSKSHYVYMLRPALEAVGHLRPTGEDFIIFPRQSTPSKEDSYDGYDLTKKTPVTITFSMKGGKKTKEPTYSYSSQERIVVAGRVSDKAKKNAQAIIDSSLVMIEKPGTQYHGMAGEVDVKEIIYHSDHIEFPVALKYDTGHEVKLWVTDDDVKTYV